MRSSSALVPKLLAVLALLVLAALVTLGVLGQRQSEQTRAELEPQITVAAQLLALQNSAEGSGADTAELQTAISESLASLAPAARELDEVEGYADLQEQILETVDALLTQGLEAEAPADRERALLSAARIWQAAGASGVAEQTYPPVLARELEGLEGFTCQNPEPAVAADGSPSEAVLAVQDALGQLGFVSEVYAARGAQEYGDVAEQSQSTARFADDVTAQLTPVLSCAGLLRAPAASYLLAAPAEAETQLNSLFLNLETNTRAALADPNLPVSADEVEVLLVKTLLDAGKAN